jgi:hypothetical protein
VLLLYKCVYGAVVAVVVAVIAMEHILLVEQVVVAGLGIVKFLLPPV